MVKLITLNVRDQAIVCWCLKLQIYHQIIEIIGAIQHRYQLLTTWYHKKAKLCNNNKTQITFFKTTARKQGQKKESTTDSLLNEINLELNKSDKESPYKQVTFVQYNCSKPFTIHVITTARFTPQVKNNKYI